MIHGAATRIIIICGICKVWNVTCYKPRVLLRWQFVVAYKMIYHALQYLTNLRLFYWMKSFNPIFERSDNAS